MREASGLVIETEARYKSSQDLLILVILRPPSLAGRANRSHDNALRGGLLVRAGMKMVLIHSSRGAKNEIMSELVRH